MKHVLVIETSDGRRFNSQAEALQYLKANHADAISKLSHRFHQKNFTDIAALLAEDEDTRALIMFAFGVQDEIANGLQNDHENEEA